MSSRDIDSTSENVLHDWAREDAMHRIQELYEESGDWDRVRAALKAIGVGE